MSDPTNRIESVENLEAIIKDGEGMFFEYYQFSPTHALKIEDLLAVLSAMEIRFPTSAFNTLPAQAKKHFIVKTRDGKVFRYKPEKQPKK